MTTKIELPPERVIDIEVVRKRYAGDGGCQHRSVLIDPDYKEITCKQCKRSLNPVEWLAAMTEHWGRITELHKRYREALDAYTLKQRTKCRHCGKITPVKPLSSADVRAIKARDDASGKST